MKGTVNIQIFKGTHVKKKTKSAWSIWNPRHFDQQMKALVWIVVQCEFGQSPVSIWICDVNPYVSSLKFKSQLVPTPGVLNYLPEESKNINEFPINLSEEWLLCNIELKISTWIWIHFNDWTCQLLMSVH